MNPVNLPKRIALLVNKIVPLVLTKVAKPKHRACANEATITKTTPRIANRAPKVRIVRTTMGFYWRMLLHCLGFGGMETFLLTATKATVVSMLKPWQRKGVAQLVHQTLPSVLPLFYPIPRPTRNASWVIPVLFVWFAPTITSMLVVNACRALEELRFSWRPYQSQ